MSAQPPGTPIVMHNNEPSERGNESGLVLPWALGKLLAKPEVAKYLHDLEREAEQRGAEKGWDQASAEAFHCGWLHDAALADLLARNPHSADGIGGGQP